MEDKEQSALFINLDELGIELGVDYVEGEPLGPIRRYEMHWTPEDVWRMLPELKKRAEGRDVEILGGAAHWILAAVCSTLGNSLKAYTMPALGLRAPFYDLPMGEPTPEGGIRFSVEREGDRVYLSFLSDDPDKPPTHGPHNYDRDALLHKVIVPAVSPDQDLLIDSQGEYSTIMNIFLAYTGKVRSMSVAGKDAESYTCVESRGGPLQVGDSIPRRS